LKDFPKLMFNLGHPLGWDFSYHKNISRQRKSQDMLLGKETPSFINFNTVLEQMVLLYVIRKELQAAVIANASQSGSASFQESSSIHSDFESSHSSISSRSHSESEKKSQDQKHNNTRKRRQSVSGTLVQARTQLKIVEQKTETSLVKELHLQKRKTLSRMSLFS